METTYSLVPTKLRKGRVDKSNVRDNIDQINARDANVLDKVSATSPVEGLDTA